MLSVAVAAVVDHPCIEHKTLAMTMVYANSRELRQTREKFQVAC